MEKTFEEKLQELEKINQNLNQGNLPLEKSLQEFEAGIALSKDCQKTLEAAEKRVRMLTEKEGSWEEKDYAETPENKQAHNLVKEKAMEAILENQPGDLQPQNLGNCSLYFLLGKKKEIYNINVQKTKYSSD